MNFKLKWIVVVVCCLTLIGGKPLMLSDGAPRLLAAKSCVAVALPKVPKHSFITKFVLIALISLGLYGCHKGKGESAVPSTSPKIIASNENCISEVFSNQNQYQLCIKEHADWLISQVVGPQDTARTQLHGLLKSYESANDPYVHVYDQAKAVMALLAADKLAPGNNYRQAAATILNALKSNLQRDLSDPEMIKSSFVTAFHLTDPAQDIVLKQTGANAFVGLAINFYTQITEDEQFVPMGEELANYLISKVNTIALSGENIKAVLNGENRAFSAEENQAVASFLMEFAVLSFDSNYVDVAIEIQQFLRRLWNNEEGRFNQGMRFVVDAQGNPLPITAWDQDGYPLVNETQVEVDTGYSADVQSGMILVLENNSGDFDYPYNYLRAIDPNAPYSVKTQLGTQNLNLPNGIAFSADAFYSGDIQNPDMEQTSRYVIALLSALRRYPVDEPPPFALFWKLEAARYLLNTESLAVISSPGQSMVHPATNVLGTHGGVFTVLAPRPPYITDESGPSVAATTETIFAKAGGINFYRASEAVNQLQQNFLFLVLALFSTISSVFKVYSGRQQQLRNSEELMALVSPMPFETAL